MEDKERGKEKTEREMKKAKKEGKGRR